MIARNEAANIGRALESVAGEVDEVIVVDTGSQDATPELARKHGARVVEFAWCDDFAEARNASLAAAKKDWIVVLDCDEQLVVEAPGALRKALRKQRGEAAAVRMADVRAGKPSGAAWNAVRIVRNLPSVRYTGRIHEKIEIAEAAPAVALDVHLPGVYLAHHGYDLDRAQTARKAERNARLIDRALSECERGDVGGRNLLLFYRAFGSIGEDRPRLLANWVEDVDRHPELLDEPVRNWVAAGLAQYATWLMDHGRAQEARGRAEQALRHFGPHQSLSLVLAREAAATGRYGEAEQHVREVTSAHPVLSPAYEGFPFDVSLVGRRGMALLAEMRERFGQLAEARSLYSALAAKEPGYLPVVLRLLCVLVQLGEFERAMEVIRSHPQLAAQDLPELDCLGLALALISKSPERDAWVERVTPRIEQDPLAERVWKQAMAAPAHRDFELGDFPELAEGVRSHLP